MVASHVLQWTQSLRSPHSFYAQEFVERLMSKRGQHLRFLMLVEKRFLSMLLLTVPTRLPILSQARRHRTQ